MAGPWQDVRINDGRGVAESQWNGGPHERLRDLQRRAFAADGDAAGDDSVATAIRELQAEIAAERAADGREVTPVGSEPAAMPGIDTADGSPGSQTAPGDPPAGADTGSAGASPRRRGPLVFGLAAALALGVLLGSGVTAALNPGSPAIEAGAAEAGATDTEATADDQPVLVSQVFSRMQTPRDIPLVAMPNSFDPDSFRYLGSAGWTDADGDGVIDSPYFAARGASGAVCLVVVPEGSGYLSTCALESAYPATGLHLSWQSSDLHPAVQDPTGVVMDITVTWLSNAMVETRGSGRPVAGQ